MKSMESSSDFHVWLFIRVTSWALTKTILPIFAPDLQNLSRTAREAPPFPLDQKGPTDRGDSGRVQPETAQLCQHTAQERHFLGLFLNGFSKHVLSIITHCITCCLRNTQNSCPPRGPRLFLNRVTMSLVSCAMASKYCFCRNLEEFQVTAAFEGGCSGGDIKLAFWKMVGFCRKEREGWKEMRKMTDGRASAKSRE